MFSLRRQCETNTTRLPRSSRRRSESNLSLLFAHGTDPSAVRSSAPGGRSGRCDTRPGGPGGEPEQPRLLQPAGFRARQPDPAANSRAQPPRCQGPLLHRRSVPGPGGATRRRVPELRSASHLRPLPTPIQLPAGGRHARPGYRGSPAVLDRRAATRAPGGRDQRRDVPVGAPGGPCGGDSRGLVAERAPDRPEPASGVHHPDSVRARGKRRGSGLPALSARGPATSPGPITSRWEGSSTCSCFATA